MTCRETVLHLMQRITEETVDKIEKIFGQECTHGQLARSCELCEKDQSIAQLHALVEDYRAEIARLRTHLDGWYIAPVAWRKPFEPQYDYCGRFRYRDDTGIGAPPGWEPLYSHETHSQRAAAGFKPRPRLPSDE